jgi:antagonist of KipI
MTSFKMMETGFLTSVQDLGREGYERFGVPVSGAMDRFALAAANRLVGNPGEAAGLEFFLQGPAQRVVGDCLIAAAGCGLELQVNRRRFPMWMSVYVKHGSLLSLVAAPTGTAEPASTWGYLAVSGGINVPQVMGSRSTYLPGGFGGWQGRALLSGDELPVGLAASGGSALRALAGRFLPVKFRPAYSDTPQVEVILGPQAQAFSEAGLQALLNSEYKVTTSSNRMGYRLEGAVIEHSAPADILSDGIVFGSVQVPAAGQPIVMMSDHQTTGGYTKITTVVSADLPLVAQCPPETGRIRFRVTSVEQAQARYRGLMAGLLKGIEEGGEELASWME